MNRKRKRERNMKENQGRAIYDELKTASNFKRERGQRFKEVGGK